MKLSGVLKKLNLENRRIVIVGIISVLLSLAFVWGYQIENYREIWLSPLVILAFLGILCANFCLIILFYALLDGRFSRKIAPRSGTASTVDKTMSEASVDRKSLASWKVFLISFVGIFILFSISFLALYPGLFVFDASWQLEMYRYHKISEHQPVLHTLILGFFVEHFKSDDWHINRGVVAYTVIQYLLASLVMAYANTFIYKKTRRILLLVIGIIFYGMFPAIVLQVMSSTKDSYFLIAIILLVTLCLEEFTGNATSGFSGEAKNETGIKAGAGNRKRNARIMRIVRLALIILSGTLAAIFRNNCIYAVPFLIIPLFIFFKEKRSETLLITAGIVILFAAYKLLLVPSVIDEKVDGREFYSVPAQQIVRIYKDNDADITGEQRNRIERLFAPEGLNEYQPRIADKTKGALDMEYYKNHRSEINKLYFDLIKKNLKTAFEAFLELSCGMWYPGSRLTLFDDGRYGYWVVGCYPPAVMNSQLSPLLEYYKLFNDSYFVTQNPISSLLFAPGTFFCLFAVMFGYAIDKKRKDFISVFIFILMLWATYLLGPLAMVRYAIYLYGIVPLYFLFINTVKESC